MTKRFDLKYWLPFLAVGGAILIAAPLAIFRVLPMTTTTLLKDIALSILLAVSLSMVVGYLGELSIGHAAFMCAGALMGGKLSVLLDPVLGSGFLSLIVCMIAGGIIAALLGLLVGLPALRLRGDYLAIVTLAFNQIICAIIPTLPASWFGGASSFGTPRFKEGTLLGSNEFFIVILLVVAACIAFSQNLLRSKHGRVIQAIRDNEIAARATGINVGRYKLIVFVAAAFFAGLAGVLYSFGATTVDASTMDFNKSIDILIMVVLGGMGNITGVMLSATLITVLNNYISIPINALTAAIGPISFGDFSLNLAVLPRVLYALILIVLMIYRNAPALKLAREQKKAQKLAAKQQIAEACAEKEGL